MKKQGQLRGDVDALFRPFAEKMQRDGLSPVVIETFRHHYASLVRGETGLITKRDIEPVRAEDIADSEKLSGVNEAGDEALEKLVVIKLNGGLGTSMGLSRAKSLLEVKDGLTFLDIIARQILAWRTKSKADLPVVFMNSFSTEADTLEALSVYRDLAAVVPLTFLQHKFPKVLQEGLEPAEWPTNPDLEWNPPGHGDIYAALVTSGMLEQLLNAGIHYAFISNSDNLGALVDKSILGYFAHNHFPFMMEVTDRTEADSKGGHIARLKDGGLTLRETAQCPEDEKDEFEDVNLYKYFNTNTIWINLPALKEKLKAHNHVIHLPMIRNPKTLDPKDDATPRVYQLETALGAAISVFEGAAAIRVPRTRFAPVKKSRDLLALWSDCFVLTEDYAVIQNPKRRLGTILVSLDSRYYKRIDQLKERFPHGAPSLLDCVSVDVDGDVLFGNHVIVKGEATIKNHSDKQMAIPDGTVIERDYDMARRPS